jgi:transposase
MIHAACWTHARRKFFQAVELNPKDQAAIGIVARIDELFSIEAQARHHRLNQEERQLARLQKSRPVLEQIKSQVQSARTDALPKSVLAKACNYTLSLWTRLNRFMEHPQLELSNNLAENAMRPVALGRRNWIHIGSEQAGPRVAAIVSVVETCRRLKIPVRDYLCSTLPGLADFPINRISELTPASWLTRN